jgi:hypothetical protein
MIERRCCARFLLEAAQSIGIGRERGGQDFNRNVAAEPRIPRAIDLTHSAGSQSGDDLVGAEAGAGSEGQEESR